MEAEELDIDLEDGRSVSGLLLTPPEPRLLYVLAHGAGAGMHHPGLESPARRLAARGVATLRYQFPYMEAGRRRPDHAKALQATVRAAVARSADLLPRVPTIAGGRSMGGRMTSLAESIEPLHGVSGLAFLAFPLHRPGTPSDDRAEHLYAIDKPMLFLSGTRDTLADLALLRGVVDRLGERATLHVVEGADHSFRVLKRSGRTAEEVEDELVEAVVEWAAALATES